MTAEAPASETPPADAPYRQVGTPVPDRVADLLARMTLAEKVAQLGSVFAFDLLGPGGLDTAALEQRLAGGVGQVTRMAGVTSLARHEVAALTNQVQRHLREETRLGIPALMHEECLAGYMAADATMFPQALAVAASWRPSLARSIGRIIGSQMRLSGAHFGLAPVLDIARDPRWGRIEETYGEDPFLTSVLGLAMVEGLQDHTTGHGIIATAKHFVGHGVPEGGRNAATPHIPPRELAEVFLAPFEQVVRHGGVGAVMHAYHDLDGVPCIANRELLTGLLREDWGFTGVVVSDYNGVEELFEAHRLVPDLQAAAVMALEAGLDVELPETSGFGEPLVRAVEERRVDESGVDDAVRRVLAQKFELGLFDDPYVDEGAVTSVDRAADELASRAAQASIVMLKNEGEVLPLAAGSTLAVIGPNASDPRALLGDYAHVAHQELLAEHRSAPMAGSPPTPEFLQLQLVPAGVASVVEALDASWDGEIRFARGCDITGDDTTGFAEAIDLARASDVAVLVLGERSGLTWEATTGESRDRTRLGLPGVQQDLLEAVVATGTPVVLVVLSGRPNSLPWAAQHVPSILWCVPPGQGGAGALAGVLTGAHEPLGRLPVTVARDVGQVPIHYGHNPSGFRSRWRGDYVDVDHRPLWPFGHGHGYTAFEISSLEAPTEAATDGSPLRVRFRAENTGRRRGETVVQIYAEQEGTSVVRPAQRLVWFGVIALDHGSSDIVEIEIPVARLNLVDRRYQRVVEPSTVVLAAGLSSTAIHARATVRLTGAAAPVEVPPPARCNTHPTDERSQDE